MIMNCNYEKLSCFPEVISRDLLLSRFSLFISFFNWPAVFNIFLVLTVYVLYLLFVTTYLLFVDTFDIFVFYYICYFRCGPVHLYCYGSCSLVWFNLCWSLIGRSVTKDSQTLRKSLQFSLVFPNQAIILMTTNYQHNFGSQFVFIVFLVCKVTKLSS